MRSTYWFPHQGTRMRRAHLLRLSTKQGWHVFGSVAPDVCRACHQPRHLLAPLCPAFLDAIPAVTSPPHDPPLPTGRLF